jgi:hypothetical protein
MSEDGSIAEEASGMDEFDWVMKVTYVLHCVDASVTYAMPGAQMASSRCLNG